MRSFFLLFAFLLFALALGCGGATVRETPAVGDVGEIAFFSDRAGGGDLYVMNGDGTDTRRLTRGSAVSQDTLDGLTTLGLEAPQWSPDGSQILFSSESGALYVVDVDSRRQRWLATNAVTADWSPDGTTIAFAKFRGDGVPDLWMMRADGSQQRRLTKNGAWPDWSPDGKTIAFSRFRGNEIDDLWLMRADGGGERRLTKNAGLPDWSPDGASVLFLRSRSAGPGIYLTRVGGAERFLAMASGPPFAWSPDGKQIAYVGEPRGHLDIVVMGVDGPGQRLLTDDPESDSFPAWSPDGKRIAFANEEPKVGEIFVVKVDGSGRRRLTHNKANDLAPVWKPAP